MRAFRKIATGLLAASLLASSVTPAFADGPYGGYGSRHRDHDHIGPGAVIAGLLGLGIIAAIASSGSSSQPAPAQNEPHYAPPPPPQYQGQAYGAVGDENGAVDACAEAAESQGGRFASVRDIKDVHATSNGWDVKGVIEQRSSYRDTSGGVHNFKCSVRNSAVQSVRIDSDTL